VGTLKIQEETGSFDKYIRNFIDRNPIQNSFNRLKEIPAETEISRIISKDMKKRGFSFVGPAIIYAHNQATGMVNDHLTDCYRYCELSDSF
jgi:DNA-3-methyladenine glycosylase I